MLSLRFPFLGSNGQAKTSKPNPNDGKPKGKLRKIKHPKTTANIEDQSMTERAAKAEVLSIGKDSMEYHQKQPAGILLNGEETEGRPNDATHTFSSHTQPNETNLTSFLISEDPSRDFSEGKEEHRLQTPISADPTQLWSSVPSVRKDTLGGGENFTHEWDDDHGDMKDWGDGHFGGPDRAPGMFISASPYQHDTQEHHDAENDREASQQQNNQLYRPIVSHATPPEENENHARRQNVSKRDHRETNEAAVLGGDHIEDTLKPEICYYIVPVGLDIIFQDEDGTQITRVGKTIKGTQDHLSHARSKNIPIVVQDVLGNELFRSGTLEAIDRPSPPSRLINHDQGSLHDPNPGMIDDFVGQISPSPNYTSWKAIIVDEKGNQIALRKYAERNVGRSTSSGLA